MPLPVVMLSVPSAKHASHILAPADSMVMAFLALIFDCVELVPVRLFQLGERLIVRLFIKSTILIIEVIIPSLPFKSGVGLQV